MTIRRTIALFGVAALGASALLFAVQPMVGKRLLPAFGGTPGVWNACLLFFQAALLVGYVYAHALTTRLGVRGQTAVHGLFLLATLGFLPIRISADSIADDPGGWSTGLHLFGLLATTAGLPLVWIAATSPLLQRWFLLASGRDDADRPREPFFLYAVGGLGNLAALAAYPIWIEPYSTLEWQNRAWAIGFAASSILTMLCAGAAWRGAGRTVEPVEVETEPRDSQNAVSGWDVRSWIGLAAVPAFWLAALTTHATTDLAPMPLLWTIPLGIYLTTYILAFVAAGRRWARLVRPAFPWLATALALVLAAGFVHLAWAPLHLATFFIGALLCHCRLAESRPAPQRLTTFYLAIGLGGVLGTFFCAILAPMLLDRMVDYPLALVLGCLASAGWGGRPTIRDAVIPTLVLATGLLLTVFQGFRDSAFGATALMLAAGLGVLTIWRIGARPLRFVLVILAVSLVGGLAPDQGGRVILRSRNFFGALRVLHDPEGRVHRLWHGSTLHGQQSLVPALREEPSTYFSRSGPIGDVISAVQARGDRFDARVAIVGLGTGTLACYARPGESWTFFEIDPAMARIAEDETCFTYLADARRRGAEATVVEGDARLRLAESPDAEFALIVLDAFSSDAVPVHLLSREAIALYRRKLAPGGLLAFNITNRYLDLDPLTACQTADAGLVCRVRYDLDDSAAALAQGRLPSIWAVATEEEADFPLSLADSPVWRTPVARPGASPWTDDYSDLASYLILGRRRPPLP